MHDAGIIYEILADNVLMSMGHRKGASYLALDAKIDLRELQHGGFSAVVKLLVETSMGMSAMKMPCFTRTMH